MDPYKIAEVAISAIGAFATFSAVFVALWQTKYANRKKLKCVFTEGITLCNLENGIKKEYVGMSISNIGNRKVILSSWGLKSPIHFYQILTNIGDMRNADPYDKSLSTKTPFPLDMEQNIFLYYPKDLFYGLVQDLIAKKEVKENERLHFVVRDSAGKEYKVKSKRSAIAYTEQK